MVLCTSTGIIKNTLIDVARVPDVFVAVSEPQQQIPLHYSTDYSNCVFILNDNFTDHVIETILIAYLLLTIGRLI